MLMNLNMDFIFIVQNVYRPDNKSMGKMNLDMFYLRKIQVEESSKHFSFKISKEFQTQVFNYL